MSRRILFVDDEPMVLMGLERLLRPSRSEWSMEFVAGGPAALEALDREEFDVIVTDMKMPEVDGVRLLEEVKRKFPRTLRFALSGESDRESMLKAVTSAHYYLTKPCEPNALRAALTRAFALQDGLNNTKVKDVIGRIGHLPSAPAVYQKLVEATQSPACNIALVSSIVERDMAITSKLLQLANSPLFGFRSQVSNPAHAVSLLGVDAVKSLVLSLGVFSEFTGDPAQTLEAAFLWEHSVLASRMTRRIAEMLGLERQAIEDSFTAGLLHEVGRLVLVTQLPAEWAEITKLASSGETSLPDAERAVLACSRNEICAYLLETWCLPTPIIEAVAWRCQPSRSPIQKVGPLAAVHIADCACARIQPGDIDRLELDKEFLTRCGIETKEQDFFTECESLVKEMQ